MRQEGPKINIQWVVLHTDRKPLSLASNDAVPAEVTLLQLWKMVIRRKVGQPTIQIMWGHHYRAGSIIETGKVTSLEEADMLEVIVDDGKAQLQTHVDVKYTVGTETFTASVRKGTTIGDFRESLAYTHRGKQIVGIAFEGVEIAKEDAVDEFLVSAFALAVLRVFVADGSDRARGEKWLPSQPSC
jgi:hypothetical protein